MTILVDYQIAQLIKDYNVITPFDPNNVQANSYDVHLGRNIQVEMPNEIDANHELNLCYYMEPGEFILAEILETFKVPDFITLEFRLNSGNARKALAHSIAINFAPGFSGVVTLELKNYSQYRHITLEYGMKIGQIIFHKHNRAQKPYKGKYANQNKVVGAL